MEFLLFLVKKTLNIFPRDTFILKQHNFLGGRGLGQKSKNNVKTQNPAGGGGRGKKVTKCLPFI